MLFSESSGTAADGGSDQVDAQPLDIDAGPTCTSLSPWIDTCAAHSFGPDVDIPNNQSWTFDTDTGAFSSLTGSLPQVQTLTIPQEDGTQITALLTTGLRIGEGATLRAVGDKALLILSERAARIDGLLTVGSQRKDCDDFVDVGAAGNSPHCLVPVIGEGDSGPGGSFGQAGGNGYLDSVAIASPPAEIIDTLRGGCPGNDGLNSGSNIALGGAGGGAIAVVSLVEINVSSTAIVQASGAGGQGGRGGNISEPGGGGGSGGMIDISAPRVHVLGGAQIRANGGGGGGGGSATNAGLNANGLCGDNGSVGGAAGTGGTEGGPSSRGGDGGRGGSLGNNAGAGAFGESDGHGGGGGGVGVIFVRAEQKVLEPSAEISPRPLDSI